MNPNFNGFITINKTSGMTSNRVNHSIKRIFNVDKCGFIGTLDPFAEGVLPVAMGHATKLIHYIEDSIKEYITEITWGTETDTYDLTGNIVNKTSYIPNINEIEKVLHEFIGDIEQTPPIYSAIKINGKRACDLTRKGIDVTIKPRTVHINKIEIISHNDKSTYIKVNCNKGVYIRSLAVDIAKRLGTLSYLSFLQRTLAYKFDINNSITVEKLLKINKNDVQCHLWPMDFVLDDIPALTIQNTYKFFNGMFEGCESDDSDLVKVYCDANFIGLGKVSNGFLYPVRVFKD